VKSNANKEKIMSTHNGFMPAAPLTEEQITRSEGGHGYEGLNKREYFAGLAMQGVLTSDPHQNYSSDSVARQAVCIADALLAELSKA